MKLNILTLLSLILLAASATAGEASTPEIGWRESFGNTTMVGKEEMPKDWEFNGAKLLVPKTQFRVIQVEDADNGKVLEIESKRSTGSLMAMPRVDLTKYPILRWRWRVRNLPPNADGRQPKLDDQVAGIYFGAGSPLSRKSIALRWETETPIGTIGSSKYGAGIVSVFTVCYRNKTSPVNEWVVEEVDAVALFEKVYGFVPGPEDYIVAVAGNSQYTQSHTFAEVDFIELVARTDAAKPDVLQADSNTQEK